MQLLRRLSLTALWALAAIGVACGVIWGLTAGGVIKPLVVISGSMEPGISTGDLLVATQADSATLAVGDVVSLPSELNENLVTHRIEAIERTDSGEYLISMKGDNNEFSDALDYTVGATVWQPALQLPGVGSAVMRLTTPAVIIPMLLGLVSLLGLTLLVPAPAARARAPKPVHA